MCNGYFTDILLYLFINKKVLLHEILYKCADKRNTDRGWINISMEQFYKGLKYT